MHRWLLSLDVGSVFVFVIAGRSNHQQSEAVLSVLHTAGPFLMALGTGWVVARAWRDPVGLRTGLLVSAFTVAGGVVLRRVIFSDGIAPSFVVVTALFITAAMMGWRMGARQFRPRRAAGTAG